LLFGAASFGTDVVGEFLTTAGAGLTVLFEADALAAAAFVVLRLTLTALAPFVVFVVGALPVAAVFVAASFATALFAVAPPLVASGAARALGAGTKVTSSPGCGGSCTVWFVGSVRARATCSSRSASRINASSEGDSGVCIVPVLRGTKSSGVISGARRTRGVIVMTMSLCE